MNVKKIAKIGILTALALVVSTLERLIPLEIVIPLPGLRLGLANIIVMLVLYQEGRSAAWCLQIVRCTLSAILFTTPISFIMSVTGGAAALLCMQLLYRCHKVSPIGIGIAGAAAHHIGQVCAAGVVMRSIYVTAYLPPLLLLSVVTGAITGSICIGVLKLIPTKNT